MEKDESLSSELEESEYVMLDLEDVFEKLHILPNAPYTLSGLDTLNPILTLDNKIKLIGEYEETIGTCLVFAESEVTPVVHEEEGPSEANLFRGACIVDPTQTPMKQVNPVTRLNRVLKFRLLLEGDSEAGAEKQVNGTS